MPPKKKPAAVPAASPAASGIGALPAALTRAAILAAEDLRREPVRVPEWGGVVWVRTLTGEERDRWETMAFVSEDGKVRANEDNIRARLVALTACDETGDLLFSVGDIEALGRKSATAINRLFDAASRVNAVSAADMEELTGN